MTNDVRQAHKETLHQKKIFWTNESLCQNMSHENVYQYKHESLKSSPRFNTQNALVRKTLEALNVVWKY